MYTKMHNACKRPLYVTYVRKKTKWKKCILAIYRIVATPMEILLKTLCMHVYILCVCVCAYILCE